MDFLTNVYAGAWDITAFLQNATTKFQFWFGLLFGLLGVILIGISGIKIFRNFASTKQQHDPKWLMTILGLIVGGAFATGGWALLSNMASGGQKTFQDLGGGAILFDFIQTSPIEALKSLISF